MKTGPLPARPDRGDFFTKRLLREIPVFRATIRSAECQLFDATDFASPTLDIGAGDGSFAQALAPDENWIGLDPAAEPLAQAKRRGAYHGLVQAVGAPLPFRTASFGSVVSNSTLEHIPEVEPVLSEMFRVLKPGGLFAVSVPSDTFYDYYLGFTLLSKLRLTPFAKLYRRWVSYTTRTKHADPPAAWRERLEALGLEIEEWRYYFSRRSTGFMEITHYTSAGSLVTNRILGRWVAWRGKVDILPIVGWVRPFSQPGPADSGSFLMFVCRKPFA